MTRAELVEKAIRDCISQDVNSPTANEAIPLLARSIIRFVDKINKDIDFYNYYLTEDQEPFKRVNEEVFMDYWFEAVEWFR